MPAGPLQVQGESLGPCLEPTLDPRFLSDIRKWQVPFWHQQLSGPSPTTSIRDHSIFNLSETIPLVGCPDPHSKAPSRRLPPLRWIQLSGRIPRFKESVMLSDYSHVLNISTPLFQWGQLLVVMDISTCQFQQSSDVLWAVMRKS